MLGYDQWTSTHTSSPQLILSDVGVDLHHHDHHHHHHHQHHNNQNHHHDSNVMPSSSDSHHHGRPIFDDHFSTPYAFPQDTTPPSHHHHHHHHQQQAPQGTFYPNQLFHDPPAYASPSYSNSAASILTLDSLSGPTGFAPLIPKTEPDPTNRPIGLNLGGRTYFSPDDDLMSRLYRRSRPADVAVNGPKCQAEGCNADLSNAKHYHRRHKVCEFHSKASTVIAAGLTQRFCQQCSRFHLLAEFDNGKRSCRKRLADHNRRRRKSHQLATQDHRMASENSRTSPSQSLQRSPTSDSGMVSPTSVTVALSPPRVIFDSSFMQRLYQ